MHWYTDLSVDLEVEQMFYYYYYYYIIIIIIISSIIFIVSCAMELKNKKHVWCE